MHALHAAAGHAGARLRHLHALHGTGRRCMRHLPLLRALHGAPRMRPALRPRPPSATAARPPTLPSKQAGCPLARCCCASTWRRLWRPETTAPPLPATRWSATRPAPCLTSLPTRVGAVFLAPLLLSSSSAAPQQQLRCSSAAVAALQAGLRHQAVLAPGKVQTDCSDPNHRWSLPAPPPLPSPALPQTSWLPWSARESCCGRGCGKRWRATRTSRWGTAEAGLGRSRVWGWEGREASVPVPKPRRDR